MSHGVVTKESAGASFPPQPSPKEAQKWSINGCYSCYGHIYITKVVLDQVLAAPTAKFQGCVCVLVRVCVRAQPCLPLTLTAIQMGLETVSKQLFS